MASQFTVINVSLRTCYDCKLQNMTSMNKWVQGKNAVSNYNKTVEY